MRLVLLALGLFFVALAPAAAQKTSSSPLTYFYQDPKPEKLAGFLEGYAKSPADWMAYPPMAGFFAIAFRRFPDWIDRLVPAQFEAKTAVTVAAAYRLSGLPPMAQSLRARLLEAAPDQTLQAQFADLPTRLEELQPATPTHLDILWGAFVASGDGRYVRTILDFLAETIDRSGEVAIDVTKITVAMSNQSNETFAEMRIKYGDAQMRQLVFASTAQWALVSNSHQHPKVRQTVDAYIAEHPQSHTAMSLSALLKK